MPTDQPKRAALYARVSSKEQTEGYSIAAQDRECGDFITGRGWTIAHTIHDEGKRASTENAFKRPGFCELVQLAKERQIDIVVVDKVDRFSRNRKTAYAAIDTLNDAHVPFVSRTEGIDFSTPWGEFALGMLIGLAELFSKNLSLETRKGKKERKLQGLYNGHLPWAVVKGPDGLPVIDPVLAPALTQMFELARDESLFTAALWLNQHGYRLPGHGGADRPPGPFSRVAVSRLCRNRLYVGELPDGQGGWLPGKHEPIVPPALFDAARAAITRRTERRGTGSCNSRGEIYALSGLLRCGECGSPMGVRKETRYGKWQYHYVRCRRTERYRNCPQGHCAYAHVKKQVTAWLNSLVIPDDMAIAAIEHRRLAERQNTDVEGERDRLQAWLARRANIYSLGDISLSQYLAERADVRRQLAALSAPPEQGNLAELAAQLRQLPALWGKAGEAEQHALLALLVEYIVVKGREVIEIAPTAAARPLLER